MYLAIQLRPPKNSDWNVLIYRKHLTLPEVIIHVSSYSNTAKELTRLQSQLVSAQKELQTYKRQAAALEKINKDGQREINELKMTVVDCVI